MSDPVRSRWNLPIVVGASVAFTVLCVVLMMLLAGWFTAKVPAASPPPRGGVPEGMRAVAVRMVSLPIDESAVGTMQAVQETTLASRILARVVEIDLRAGQPVGETDVLVRLDESDLKARLQQAEAAVLSASAQHDQAQVDEKRLRSLLDTRAVSPFEYEKAAVALKTADANLQRAQQMVAEAKAVLAFATIRSPMKGVVVDKKVNLGDTVVPGQPLVTVYDPSRMQLVANVRESLARRLSVGQQITVHLDVMGVSFPATISEIVPDASSASRTFQVKAVGAAPQGLYTGMFGRMFVPLDQQEVIAIPADSVSQAGQIQLVSVLVDGRPQRRAVRTGRRLGDGEIEVLSGLSTGEMVLQPLPAATRPAGTVRARGAEVAP